MPIIEHRAPRIGGVLPRRTAACLVACVVLFGVGCGHTRPQVERERSPSAASSEHGGSETTSDSTGATRPDSNRKATEASASTEASLDTSGQTGSSRDDAPTPALKRLLDRAIDRVGRARQRGGETAAQRAALEVPTRYPIDRHLSPITPHVARHLRRIAERGPQMHDHVFTKVGGSNTVNPNFVQCFAGEHVDLAGRDHLRETIEVFASGPIEDVYTRESKAAEVGWSAKNVLMGDPPPLLEEIRTLQPRFAVVMYGTNDIGWMSLDQYAEYIFGIVETLTDRGVIPILTSIPPRGDDPEAARRVPRFNTVLRGIAQARQLPFIDLNRALRDLPDQGLGGDGLHMTAMADSYFRPCVFTEEGLRHGHNTRNLLTIQMLHRLRRAVVEGKPAPDALKLARAGGEGTADEPVQIESLPFTDGRDTTKGGRRHFDRYPGCDPEADQSGPEFVYALELDRTLELRASVVDRPGVDLDLHLLEGAPTPSNCRERADHTVRATLSPGRYYLVVDTFAPEGEGPKPGEFVLTVREEPMEVSRRALREQSLASTASRGWIAARSMPNVHVSDRGARP